MKIHHLNCGCQCPVGGALFDGFSRRLTSRLVCHCLLLETPQHGLVLIDTGFGEQDVEAPRSRLHPFFIAFNNIQFERRLTAYHQIRALGFDAGDVRHIVLTHLDFDHAGGLSDFPNATVHVLQKEADQAHRRDSFLQRGRYRPLQWQSVRKWQTYTPSAGEAWFGFEAVRELNGLPPEILFIPLPGHTIGHAGIAIDTGSGWLLHAGDAYFYRDEMRRPKRRCTPGLRLYQTMMEQDRKRRLENQQRLRELSVREAGRIGFLCSHDAREFESALAASERVHP